MDIKIDKLPAVWLLAMMVGLPMLSETVYTPALPDIARALQVPNAWAEYTLTIYLVGFAIGTLFWGKLSDFIGRKPALLGGFFIYVLGCVGCYYANSIELLMVSRFVQAFGGSAGSVLGQAICRDAYHGPALGKIYSTVGSVLAISPAIGPILGGFIDQHYGWSAIFLALMAMGSVAWLLTAQCLVETHPKEKRVPVAIFKVIGRMCKDSQVIAFGLLVAGCNGISFSYFAEGPFYLIDLLGLSPSVYGMTFVGNACAGVLGGYVSRRLHDRINARAILRIGLLVVLLGGLVFSGVTFAFREWGAPALLSIILTVGSMMVVQMGCTVVTANALSLALKDYRHAVGTASSFFGFFYYTLIALFTLGMGTLHNGTLLPMPLYFLGVGIFMWVVFKGVIGPKKALASGMA